MTEANAYEASLAEALEVPSRSDVDVRRLVDALPTGTRFTQLARWLELARNERLPTWRRLAALSLALSHGLSYPIQRAGFVREVLAPLGLSDAAWIDMSIAQHVPLERRDDTVIRMIHLPIETPVGPAAVYASLREASDTIEQAAVSPDLDRSGAP
ncbi:MAG TPA: hypothetical protein VGJ60_08905 [Chloroflexota bacterium]|jgi:hypothetical protein